MDSHGMEPEREASLEHEAAPASPSKADAKAKFNLKDVNWKDFLIGDYDWGFLCMPRNPFGKPGPPPPFYGKDEPISMLVALSMGLQHCLAMVGGIVTVPLILSGPFNANFSDEGRAYIISAALIVSGIATLIQVTQIKIPYTRIVIGSGMLSVMGVSFTFLPISESAVHVMMSCSCQGVPCAVGSDACNSCPAALVGNCLTGEQAYGKILGTVMVCAWLQVLVSFVPLSILRRIFPPVVTGTTVLLIGIALSKVGISYWGGGAYCAEQVLTSGALCQNGQVTLPFGSPQFVGLGFTVFFTLVFLELFGSPFMRNVQVVIGLLVGMIVASAVSYNNCSPNPPTCESECFYVLPSGVQWNSGLGATVGAPNSTVTFPQSTVCSQSCTPNPGTTCVSQRYVTGDQIEQASWVTFLWVNTYPLGFYPPVVLPMLFGIIVSCMECIGDITATTEASGLVPVGPEYEQAVSGALLSDGLSTFWGALATTLPCVTYAANNGIISLTRCAARRAGWAAGSFLIIMGIIQKFAAIILTIPDCILGGITGFLFINVAVSGMRIITMEGGINRRNRFICAMALTLGIGVELVPAWFNIAGQAEFPLQGWLWPINPDWSPGVAGLRDAIIIVMTNGFSIGGFTAVILNLILPYDADDVDEMGEEDSHVKTKMHLLETQYPHPHMDNPVDPLHPQTDTEMATQPPLVHQPPV